MHLSPPTLKDIGFLFKKKSIKKNLKNKRSKNNKPNKNCRFCHTEKRTIQHVIGAFPKLSMYLPVRHNKVGKKFIIV